MVARICPLTPAFSPMEIKGRSFANCPPLNPLEERREFFAPG
jgi:hypothetical protein